MTIDQAERLTEKTAVPDARRFVESLPLQSPDAQSLKDLLAQDVSDESLWVRRVLTSLTWITFTAALGVVILMVHAVANGYLRH